MEIDDTTSCSLCFEEFNDSDHVPRLLPCAHTACDPCLTQMIAGRAFIVCHECRKRHIAKSGSKSFPQNKYVLDHVESKNKTKAFAECPNHNRELSLFCKEDGCIKAICQLCLLESHLTHRVVDYLQDKEKELTSRVEEMTTKADKWKAAIENVQSEMNAKCEASLATLSEQRDYLVEKLAEVDKSIEKVSTQRKDQETLINRRLCIIMSNKGELASLIEKGKAEELLPKLKKCEEIEGALSKIFKGRMFFKYNHFSASGRADQFGGHVIGTEKSLCYSENQVQVHYVDTALHIERYVDFLLLSDDTLAVLVMEKVAHFLQKLNSVGSHMVSMKLDGFDSCSMVEVSLAGTPCICVFDKFSRLNFYDVEGLVMVCCFSSVACRIAHAGPAMLMMVENLCKDCLVVKWLDCATNPPLISDKKFLELEMLNVRRILHMQDGVQGLVVVLTVEGALRAYNTDTSELMWERNFGTSRPDIDIKISGGRIFLYDFLSRGVQMYSASGEFHGPLSGADFVGIKDLRFNSCSSSLVVVHMEDGIPHIKSVKAQV